jgi:hypothetical protein
MPTFEFFNHWHNLILSLSPINSKNTIFSLVYETSWINQYEISINKSEDDKINLER